MNCLNNLFIICALLSPHSLTIKRAIEELPNQNQAPRMITMSIYEDAKTQMAFNWNTTWETDTIIQVSENKDTDFSDNIIEKEGTVEKSKILNDGYIHRVVVDNLKENTTYYYRLGDKKSNSWSDVGTFKTANDKHGSTFIHISDPQGYEKTHYSDYNELLTLSTKQVNPDFYCLTGDIVNNSFEDATPVLEQWEWALTDQKEFMQNIPFMTTAGNHEEAEYDYTSRFNHPVSTGAIQNDGSYYSFNYQGSHFISLNTNDTIKTSGLERGLSTEQIEWLENDLKNNTSFDFTIVMMHKGIYDAGGHCSNTDGEDNDIALIRKQLSPIFTKYKVDLVLQGHDHLYSRSYPLEGKINENKLVTTYNNTPSKIEKTFNNKTYSLYQNPQGTIYLNSGSASGSKFYQAVDYDKEQIPLERVDSATHRMFTEIIIEGNNLYANVYKVSNGSTILFDTFGIEKNKNINTNTNQNINNIENSDENSKKEFPIELIIGIAVGVIVLAIGSIFIIKLLKSKEDKN